MSEIINQLQKISEFEKSLKRIQLHNGSALKVELDRSIKISVSGEVIQNQIDRPLIHQIGGRIWENQSNDYLNIRKHWDEAYKKDKNQLERDIEQALKGKGTMLLIEPNSNKLYGMVSEQFVTIDPLGFRKQFVEYYKSLGGTRDEESKLQRTAFMEPVEYFTFNESSEMQIGEPIRFGVGVVYGLNNGYSSFRVRLSREVLVCLNGLTNVENEHFAQLKHSKEASIPKFIEEIKANVYTYNSQFQKRIEDAKQREIQQENYNELFRRLHVSTVVKNRIKERFDIESKATGNNEWSLSQSFTNLATHFYKKGADKHHETILTEVGSGIVDQSIEFMLNQKVQEEQYREFRTYSNFLP